MSIIVQHFPGFMAGMQGQTEMTPGQALEHNPRTEKLGAKIEVALASLGRRGGTKSGR